MFYVVGHSVINESNVTMVIHRFSRMPDSQGGAIVIHFMGEEKLEVTATQWHNRQQFRTFSEAVDHLLRTKP